MKINIDPLLKMKQPEKFLREIDKEREVVTGFCNYWVKTLDPNRKELIPTGREISQSDTYARLVDNGSQKGVQIFHRKHDPKFDKMGEQELFDFMNKCLR